MLIFSSNISFSQFKLFENLTLILNLNSFISMVSKFFFKEAICEGYQEPFFVFKFGIHLIIYLNRFNLFQVISLQFQIFESKTIVCLNKLDRCDKESFLTPSV